MIKRKNKKILSSGDLHLNSSTPKSRIDSDYGQTCINKLKQIYKICKNEDVEIVIVPGDIYHKNNQPLKFINKVAKTFKKFKNAGIEIFAIAGNHDLSYDKIKYLDNSPLGNLLISELIKPLDEIQLSIDNEYDVYIKGYNFPEKVEKSEDKGDINICVSHRYFEKYDREFLTSKDLKNLGYDIYILGHDHVSFKPQKVGNSYLLRPGSLLRGTSHDYQLERGVYVDIIEFEWNGNKPKVNFKRKEIKTISAEKVFTSAVFGTSESEDRGDVLTNISESLDSLLDKMNSVGNVSSIYKFLDEVDVRDEVKEIIEMYLDNYGIYRVEDD